MIKITPIVVDMGVQEHGYRMTYKLDETRRGDAFLCVLVNGQFASAVVLPFDAFEGIIHEYVRQVGGSVKW